MKYEYQIESKTEECHEKIIQCLYALGYKNCDTSVNSAVEYTKKYNFCYPWNVIDVDRKVFSGNTSEFEKYKTVTFDELLSLKKELKIEVKLDSTYTAIVSKDGIEMLNQTFPLSIALELISAVEKVKNQI